MSTERKPIHIPEGDLTKEYFIQSLAPISSVPMNADIVLRREFRRMIEFREKGFIDEDTEVITEFARDRIKADLSPYAAILSIAYMKAVAAARTFNAWENAEPNEARDEFCSLNLVTIHQTLEKEVRSFVNKVQSDETAEQIIQLVEDRFQNPRTLSTFDYGPNDHRDLSPDGEKLWYLLVCESGDWEFLPTYASEDGFDLESSIQELRTLDLLDETDPTRLRSISFPI